MNILIEKYGFLFFYIVTFLTFIGIPIPCEIIMPLFGSYLNNYNFSLWNIVIINSISLIASIILYIIGKRIKKENIKSKKILKAFDYYEKHQNISVLIGRFIPIVRIYISLVSGINKQKFLKFFIYSFIGIFIYNSFLIILGYTFANNIDYIITIIDKIKDIMIVSTIIISVILLKECVKCKR